MKFESPFWLICLLPLIMLFIFQHKKQHVTTIKFPNINIFKQLENKKSKWLAMIVKYIRMMILIVIVLTLARPQLVNFQEEVTSKGIDIMIALDTSKSMSAEDLVPDNRLTVSKKTIKDFISKRTADQIGLVVFGAEAFTQSPLTTDYNIVLNLLDDIEFSMVGDGTAIGTAIITALNRLKDSPAKSKIIILLTDGENNMGQVDPQRAAELAKDLGVKIYTIGVGKEGGAPIPYDTIHGKRYSNFNTYLDETTLKNIAKITNAVYFRAKDTASLENIYRDINALETSEIKTIQYEQVQELFQYGLYLILSLLLLELVMYNIFLVVSP